jgi:hypothetical protein
MEAYLLFTGWTGTQAVLYSLQKNEAAHKHLSLQFEERSTRKIYAGLVIGKVQPPKGLSPSQ